MLNSREILHCKMKINILFTSWLKKTLTYMYYTMYIAILIYVLIIIRTYYNIIIYNYQHPIHNTHLRQSCTNIHKLQWCPTYILLRQQSCNWQLCLLIKLVVIIVYLLLIISSRHVASGGGQRWPPPPPTFLRNKDFS